MSKYRSTAPSTSMDSFTVAVPMRLMSSILGYSNFVALNTPWTRDFL